MSLKRNGLGEVVFEGEMRHRDHLDDNVEDNLFRFRIVHVESFMDDAPVLDNYVIEWLTYDASGGECWIRKPEYLAVDNELLASVFLAELHRCANWIERARAAIAPIGTAYHIPGHSKGEPLNDEQSRAIADLQSIPEWGTI